MNSEVLLVCIVALLSFVRAWQVREGASGVGIGWAKVLREAKVRASKSKGSEVVGNLHEGARVLVEEVSSKAARIHLPFAGWISLAKASGPVLEQDSCNRRGSGEKSATQWVMEHTLARLRPADGHIGERVSMPSEMPVHPPECPEPADQETMDTTSKLFAQLPSVGTWLAATPPVSALAAIDEGFPNPRVAPTNPLFVQLPSVGTWLVANASMAQRLVPPGCICSAALGSPHRASTGPVRAPSLCVQPSSLRGYVVHALRNACKSARVPRACRPRGNGHHFKVIRPAPLSGHVACSNAARECIGSN